MASKKTSTKKSVKTPEVFEQPEEHRVFSHLMYLLFLVATAMAAYYTFNMFIQPETQGVTYMPVKSLVLLAWAFIFKTFGHRIHYPHH